MTRRIPPPNLENRRFSRMHIQERLLHSNFNLLEGCLRWGRNFSRRAFVGGNGWEAKKGIRAWKSGAILEATCFETTALGIDA